MPRYQSSGLRLEITLGVPQIIYALGAPSTFEVVSVAQSVRSED
jgi:hypothetical protein